MMNKKKVTILVAGILALAFILGVTGALSLAGMIPLSRVKGINIITVSMVGAVLHNVGQIIAAAFVMSEVSPAILLRYLAVLIAVALVTGAATGILAREVINRLGHVVKKRIG